MWILFLILIILLFINELDAYIKYIDIQKRIEKNMEVIINLQNEIRKHK